MNIDLAQKYATFRKDNIVFLLLLLNLLWMTAAPLLYTPHTDASLAPRPRSPSYANVSSVQGVPVLQVYDAADVGAVVVSYKKGTGIGWGN